MNLPVTLREGGRKPSLLRPASTVPSADVMLHHLLQNVDLIGRGSPVRGQGRKAYLLVTIDEATFNRLCEWDTADDEDGHDAEAGSWREARP